MTRPICLIQEDAVTLKGIVELLANEPATISEIEMTQHIGYNTARRLLKILKDARIVEKEMMPRVHRGILNYVETLRWKLTSAYIAGEVPFEPEILAGGIAYPVYKEGRPPKLARHDDTRWRVDERRLREIAIRTEAHSHLQNGPAEQKFHVHTADDMAKAIKALLHAAGRGKALQVTIQEAL